MASSFTTIDLNLLRVFDAVMEERSVLRASQKVFLSQSAVSHSLARLREVLEDELFVRTSSGMLPTARALAMAPRIREALLLLEAAVELPSFEPSTATKRFTIAANDFTTMVVMPAFYETMRAEAPHVEIAIKPVTRIDLAEQIDLGRIDAAIGTFSSIPQRFRSTFLFEYDDVLIAGPKRKMPPLTVKAFSDISIAVVSFGGDQEGAIDGFISERGLARRSEMYDRTAFEKALSGLDRVTQIAVSLPHFLALPALLANSGLAAIVPRPLAQAFLRAGAVSVHELPYPTARLEVRLLWHERHDADASQDWLHEAIRKATDALRVTLPK
jgi:DNA-binding transcriptional LysR family regulator